MRDSAPPTELEQPACAVIGCTRTAADGPLWRVNPKGRTPIVMCTPHSKDLNTWHNRLRRRTNR